MCALTFQNCREITAKNYQSLPELQQQQMALSATMGFGDEYTTAEDFLAQSGDGDLEEGVVELWDVVDQAEPEKVIYDCWVYLADTANVFLTGTTTDTEAAMMQWSFDDQTGDGSNKQLCKDLQKAFDAK